MKKHLTESRFQIVLFFAGVLFYAFFTWLDGAVICVDSPSYISMSLAREPIYPLFLAFFRVLFGEGYLLAVVWAQGLLSAVAAFCLARFLTREFDRNRWDNCVLLTIPLLVSLLCRFAAKRGVMYSNSILSEGICIPLFLLFARFLLEYWFHRKKKALVWAGILSVVMISARKQMMVTLLLLVAIVFLAEVWNKENKKRFLRGVLGAVLCGLAVYLGVSGIDRGYNYVLRGENVRHSSGGRFLLTVLFYEADREDAETIQDEEAKTLFLDIYDTCEKQGYLGKSAEKGWFNRVEHFTNHYDHIQIDTMWPMIRQWVNQNYTGNDVERELEIDRIMDRMTNSLLPVNWMGILRVFADNVLAGFVVTVAKMWKILVFYAIIAYSSMGVLWGVLLKKRGLRSKENKLAVYTMLSILCNVGAVSAVIFCQTRYMIYNMPLFYMCGYLLLRSCMECIGGGTKERYEK